MTCPLSQGVETIDQRAVLLPRRNVRKHGRANDFLKSIVLHLKTGPRIYLRRCRAFQQATLMAAGRATRKYYVEQMKSKLLIHGG